MKSPMTFLIRTGGEKRMGYGFPTHEKDWNRYGGNDSFRLSKFITYPSPYLIKKDAICRQLIW